MRRLSLFAALPLILLLLSLGVMGLRSHLIPISAVPKDSATDGSALPPMPQDGLPTEPVSPAPPETMPPEHILPYLLYSAADQPPMASAHYDLLFATDPESPLSGSLILSRDQLPPGGALILRKDLSARASNGLALYNETAYAPDLQTLATLPWAGAPSALPALAPSDAAMNADPLVLIYHTHATEAFLPEDAACIEANQSFRSTDPKQTVVALGATVAQILNESGIPAIHCTVMHDLESYDRAYENARATIKDCLARYPSIRYLLDIHRDALITVDGDHIRPVASLADGSEAAQIMLVIGTDEGGAYHPGWQTNLALACKLQSAISASTPDLMRPLQLRSASFLGQYAPGALLLEIGSAASTLSQAQRAAELFARQYAQVIRSIEG